jgi:hypothetical protein
LKTGRLHKIVSGGQTGADRAALDWAISRGVAHGGWCPKGRRAEDGPIPDGYALQETDSPNYLIRTEQNVIDSDGTVVFSIKPLLSGGSKKTADFARKHGKPLLHLHPGIETPGQQLAAFIRTNGIKVLNVAGSRLSGEPRIAEFVLAALKAANLRE